MRHLFTGQQWYKEMGLYDLRNRFYSPDIGRFLQADPIGFWGGNNLYRYCGNNPVTSWDPFGLVTEEEKGGVEVFGDDPWGLNTPWGEREFTNPGEFGRYLEPSNYGGGGGGGGGGRRGLGKVASAIRNSHPFGNGGSTGEWATDVNGEGFELVTGWMDPISGAFLFGPAQRLGFGSFDPAIGSMVMTGYGSNYLGLLARQSNHVTRGFTNVANPMDDPNAFVRAVGREFGSYGLVPFANFMDYGVAYPAAAAVAAPVGYAGYIAASNIYLTNPVFWTGVATTAGPAIAGFGGGQPVNYPTSTGQAIGQWIGLGWKWLTSGNR